MKTIKIKGKEYVQVNERIKEFWILHPEWSINTHIVSSENNVIVMKTTVKDEEQRTRASGYAYEKEGSSLVNKTSYIENCETSAVGRALGILGIGLDTSVASAEEVQTAIHQQNAPVSKLPPKPVSKEAQEKNEKLKIITDLYKDLNEQNQKKVMVLEKATGDLKTLDLETLKSFELEVHKIHGEQFFNTEDK